MAKSVQERRRDFILVKKCRTTSEEKSSVDWSFIVPR